MPEFFVFIPRKHGARGGMWCQSAVSAQIARQGETALIQWSNEMQAARGNPRQAVADFYQRGDQVHREVQGRFRTDTTGQILGAVEQVEPCLVACDLLVCTERSTMLPFEPIGSTDHGSVTHSPWVRPAEALIENGLGLGPDPASGRSGRSRIVAADRSVRFPQKPRDQEVDLQASEMRVGACEDRGA